MENKAPRHVVEIRLFFQTLAWQLCNILTKANNTRAKFQDNSTRIHLNTKMWYLRTVISYATKVQIVSEIYNYIVKINRLELFFLEV